MRTALLLCALLPGTVRAQQGFIPPQQESFGAGPPAPKKTDLRGKTVQAGSVVLAVSESGNTVYAFAVNTGKVVPLKLNPQVKQPIQPTAYGDLVAFVHGTRAYAFNGLTGKWADVELGVSAKPTMMLQHVEIRLGPKLYLFSVASENWTMIDLSKD